MCFHLELVRVNKIRYILVSMLMPQLLAGASYSSGLCTGVPRCVVVLVHYVLVTIIFPWLRALGVVSYY